MAVSDNKFLGVKPIIIPEKGLQRLKHVIGSYNYGPNANDSLQKRISGMYSVCGGIHFYQVLSDVENATRIERDCRNCIKNII